MPITTMPAMTISVRESCRASMMMAPSPVGTPVISPTTITTQAKPNPNLSPEDAGQGGRQHDLGKDRRARGTQHAGGLEQARIDAAHAEHSVNEDGIEGPEEDEKERAAR